MGNHIAITVNGKHETVKKLFITDESGKHRKVKKGFLTVGGKHKLVFAAGHDWVKYNAVLTPGHYEEKPTSGYYTTYGEVSSVTLYDSYSFSKAHGYQYSGATTFTINSDLSAAVGKYYKLYQGTQAVERVVELIANEANKTIQVKAQAVASCDFIEDAYVKGSTTYGTIFADEGELPEAGTLIKGSVAEGYCVLEIGGVKYYYELVE